MQASSDWLRSLSDVTRALWCKLTGASDYRRWTNPESLSATWDTRTRTIAGLIPAGATVVEFGAGRQVMKQHLDASCRYHPFDLSESQGATFCDLNQIPLPELAALSPDVAVFSGVLEYVGDIPALAQWLSRFVPCCIASYACVGSRSGSVRRVLSGALRLRWGWVNGYSERELLEIFAAVGLSCVKTMPWNAQTIFLFERE